MTETMLERMAKAMAISDGYTLDELKFHIAANEILAGYERCARDALEAIREPSREDSMGVFVSFSNDDEAAWTAMIDAILSQSQEGC